MTPRGCAASIPAAHFERLARRKPTLRVVAAPDKPNRWHGGGGSLCCRRRPIVMSYVQRVLQPGEQVRHISSIHWIGYWPGVAVALLAVLAYWLSETRHLPGFWRY